MKLSYGTKRQCHFILSRRHYSWWTTFIPFSRNSASVIASITQFKVLYNYHIFRFISRAASNITTCLWRNAIQIKRFRSTDLHRFYRITTNSTCKCGCSVVFYTYNCVNNCCSRRSWKKVIKEGGWNNVLAALSLESNEYKIHNMMK